MRTVLLCLPWPELSGDGRDSEKVSVGGSPAASGDLCSLPGKTAAAQSNLATMPTQLLVTLTGRGPGLCGWGVFLVQATSVEDKDWLLILSQ